MGEETKPKGNLFLAFVGYFGVIASAVTGINRLFVIGFATFGFLGYVLANTKYHRYKIHHAWMRRLKTHFHTSVNSTLQTHPPGSGYFSVVINYGVNDQSMPEEIPEKLTELLALRNFRCEFRKPWHFKKIVCESPKWKNRTNYLEAIVSQEITETGNGKLILLKGRYIVRWKHDDAWKSLAKCYFGFNETGWSVHPFRRMIFKYLKWKEKVQNESQWEQLWS